MQAHKKSPLHNLYKKFLNLYTQTTGSEHLPTALKEEFQSCRKSNRLLSLAIIRIPSLPVTAKPIVNPEWAILLKKIITTIKANLRSTDMIFYNGAREITCLFPKTGKSTTRKLLNKIRTDLEGIPAGNSLLAVKGGYAGFPTDAHDLIKLQECAAKALSVATQSPENRIIGYFTEKRNAARIPLKIEVRYAAQGAGNRLTCSRNLSQGGIRISGMPDLPLGNDIKLTFELPQGNGNKISVTARTVWSSIYQKTGKMDIGLCFTRITNTAKQEIEEYIRGTIPPMFAYSAA